jgi:hypothetical protein
LFRLTACEEGRAVFGSTDVVFAKNWIVLRLLLTGVPPVQVPWVFGPPVNQSRLAVGVAVTLELAQVYVVCAEAEEIAKTTLPATAIAATAHHDPGRVRMTMDRTFCKGSLPAALARRISPRTKS